MSVFDLLVYSDIENRKESKRQWWKVAKQELRRKPKSGGRRRRRWVSNKLSSSQKVDLLDSQSSTKPSKTPSIVRLSIRLY